MKVAFFGSPAFALPVFEAVRAEFDVVLVVAQPDKPVGRGLKLTPPPIAARARELGLSLAQPQKLRKNAEFEEVLQSSGADVAVTCAYGKILPGSLLRLPPHGFLNTHTSLLPKYRGAAPIQWALIEGETVTGTTIMQTDEGMDTGPILLQEALAIEPNWTNVELAGALSEQASRLIVRALRDLDHLSPTAQDDALATHARMLEKADGELRWTDAAQRVYDRYRGTFGWPGSFTAWKGKSLKVNTLRPASGRGEPGEVLTLGDGLVVACGEGAVELLTVQPEGKKPMNARDWWNGAGGKLGDRFEFSS
ncbi:methionyl-tRNA formyltransferase [Deinococcus yavapaiensis]|uniref:Methionyl-tRNA formyltransferase n=1 Tax=Deinococcus yavapaiensis KR-236 TaxID=694435 RepID=A0A318SDS0_9DEIO|nr:methionyl-tRNA formyltransferase [Deinococcus yavapaiensis]PYE55688.1 methionyl-tRNA formyltransferase [Deinococcus yavapaiensis KR-236]